MAEVVRLPNGNVFIQRALDGSEDKLSNDEILAKVRPQLGVTLPNGNVYTPTNREAELIEAAVQEQLKGGKTSPARPAVTGKPPWTMSVSPGSYLRRFGLEAPQSDKALACLGLTKEQYGDVVGLKEDEPPPAEPPVESEQQQQPDEPGDVEDSPPPGP